MTIISLPVYLVKFFMSTPYGVTSMTLYQRRTRSLTNVFSSAISLAEQINGISACKVTAIRVTSEVYRVNEKTPEPGSDVAIVGLFSDSQYVGSDYQTVRVPGLRQSYQLGYPPFNYGEVDFTITTISNFVELLNTSFNFNRVGEALTYDFGTFILDTIGSPGKDLPGS